MQKIRGEIIFQRFHPQLVKNCRELFTFRQFVKFKNTETACALKAQDIAVIQVDEDMFVLAPGDAHRLYTDDS